MIERKDRNPINLTGESLASREPVSPVNAFVAVKRFENKLKNGGIAEAIRYETQATAAPQMAIALINLATEIHPGKPISNGYLLHEMAEGLAFRRLGFDFSSKRLLRMSHVERAALADQRAEQYNKEPGPHLEGMKEQYSYLQAVALSRGYQLSLGTLLELSPTAPVREVEKVQGLSAGFFAIPAEEDGALQFYRELLDDEPKWRAHLESLHSRLPIRFFEREKPTRRISSVKD